MTSLHHTFFFLIRHKSLFTYLFLFQLAPLLYFPYHPISSHPSPLCHTRTLQASTWIDVLTAEEVGRTLRRSDLDKLLEILEVIPMGIVASQQQVSCTHILCS